LAAGFAAAAAAAGADSFSTIAERATQLTDFPYPASFAAAVALPFFFLLARRASSPMGHWQMIAVTIGKVTRSLQ
jgi:hypothetical protein